MKLLVYTVEQNATEHFGLDLGKIVLEFFVQANILNSSIRFCNSCLVGKV